MSTYPGQEKPPPGATAAPVAVQPVPGAGPVVGPGGWQPAPNQVPANCPPGLEYLAQVDQLLVKQKLEGLEMFTGFETNNKYEVLNSLGQRIYYAVEDTCCCTRNCCGASRPFDIKILDNRQKEVIHLSRPLRCRSCWFPCCLQKVSVEAPPGKTVGYVCQSWSLCKPRYSIQNAEGDVILRIKGPCCTWNICGEVEFDVYAPDEETYVGRITKQWSGVGKELFTDADNFGVSFPVDLDVSMKAVVLGCVFLIDFMYFEDNTKKDDKNTNNIR